MRSRLCVVVLASVASMSLSEKSCENGECASDDVMSEGVAGDDKSSKDYYEKASHYGELLADVVLIMIDVRLCLLQTQYGAATTCTWDISRTSVYHQGRACDLLTSKQRLH